MTICKDWTERNQYFLYQQIMKELIKLWIIESTLKKMNFLFSKQPATFSNNFRLKVLILDTEILPI